MHEDDDGSERRGHAPHQEARGGRRSDPPRSGGESAAAVSRRADPEPALSASAETGATGQDHARGKPRRPRLAVQHHGRPRMIALDTNILVYAWRTEAAHHAAARKLVTNLAEGDQAWSLPWPCIYEY